MESIGIYLLDGIPTVVPVPLVVLMVIQGIMGPGPEVGTAAANDGDRHQKKKVKRIEKKSILHLALIVCISKLYTDLKIPLAFIRKD